MTIALVAALIGGGVYAWFSDTEQSTNNSIAAGTLDLNVDGGNVAVTTFSETNRAPNDSGSGSTTLANVGSLSGELDIATSAVTNTPGGGGTEYEGGAGELGANTELAAYIDVDQSAAWSAGDIGLKSDGTTYTYSAATTGTATGGSTTTVVETGAGWTVDEWVGHPVTVTGKGTAVVTSNTIDTLTVDTLFSSAVTNGDSYSIASGPLYDTIDNYASTTWDAVETMAASAADDFIALWQIPSTAGNDIQGDSCSFDITFTLEQADAD